MVLVGGWWTWLFCGKVECRVEGRVWPRKIVQFVVSMSRMREKGPGSGHHSREHPSELQLSASPPVAAMSFSTMSPKNVAIERLTH